MTIEYKDSKRIVGLSTDFQTSGLKAYWKMNESSGNLLNTASAQNSDSTMSADLVSSGTVNRGTAGHVSGVDSIGFPTYDADGNKVTANNSASDYGFMNKAAAKFTACWWAKNESHNSTVDLWGLGGNGNGADISFRNKSSGFTIWFSGTEYTSFTHNVGDNNWHFYMLSWDEDGGSDNAQFQLDGTKQTATITTSNTSDSASTLTIGDVSGNEPEMDIQEFSLWNRVLTDAEIALIYNSGNGAELQNTTIVGSKPTDVQDNSILVEKDTASRYWFSEALAPTFENDFGTTSDWTKVGTTITVNDHVSGKCSINDPATTSSDRVHKSLGATLSDTAWVATCEINISAISGSERAFPVQFSSTTGAYRSSHDSIAIRLGGDLSGSSPSIGMSRNDGGTVTNLTDANSIQVSTGTLYYVKIWRDGSDLKLAVYTNSDYETGQVGSTQTHQSLGSPTGLSNVVIGSDDGSAGGVNATVDNLKVYNNVTTPTPATWNVPSKTPAEIGDLKVHYDATVGVTASSNSVSAWADQSGNGKTLSSVSNPTRVEAGQNGKDYLDFNSSKSMRATGLSETAPRPFTMVLVINPRNGGSQSIIRWSQNQYLALYQNPANTYDMTAPTAVSLTDSTLDGSWNAFFMDFKSDADGGTFQINLDTANAVSGDLGDNGTSGTTATLHVGINADNNNWHANCRYAEIIIFDKVLTAYEKEQLYSHLKTKWGLP